MVDEFRHAASAVAAGFDSDETTAPAINTATRLTGPVAAILAAAFNRSTLLDAAAQPATDPAGFYAGSVTNHYAQAMHANSKDAKAYGFAFDDVAGFASYIQDEAPSAVNVTLTPF